MNPVVERRADLDVTDVPSIVNGAVKLGLLECVFVLLISLVSHLLPNGALQTVLVALLVLVGLAAVTLLPGLWTRARTIEGIAGAAGIGLGATVVFLLVDVTVLQNIGARSGSVSPVIAFVTALACAVVLALLAMLIHVPLAGWNLGTFGVAFLPGLALAKLLTGLGARRA